MYFVRSHAHSFFILSSTIILEQVNNNAYDINMLERNLNVNEFSKLTDK